MNRDPYLVPGQVCEVWDNKEAYIELHYFYKYDSAGFPIFLEQFYRGKLDVNALHMKSRFYKPIGTEWNFIKNHPKQEKFVCSTVDKSGKMQLWTYSDLKYGTGFWYHGRFDEELISIDCGICPDKTRYEGNAWKTSLRMRPDWAKVG